MKLSFYKKFIIVVITIAITSAAIPQKRAEAFFGFDTLNAAIQGIGHAIQGALLGIDSAANSISASLQTVDQILKGVPIEYGAVRAALSTASLACEQIEGGVVSGLVLDLAGSVSGVGDQTKSTTLVGEIRKLTLLNAKLTCYSAVHESYTAALTGAFDEQIKQALRDVLAEIETRKAPINVQRTEVQKNLQVSSQDIFKAIALGVAMTVNEQYTAQTIRDLKPQLALGSYGKTMDALASQVYAVEYIKKNYDGDKSKQLIMTSLLDSEVVPSSAAKQQAVRTAKALVDAELAQKCPQYYELVNWEDADVFTKAAQYVGENCSPEKTYDTYQHELQHVLTQSKEAAKAEVANGGGFMSTRSCRDVSSQEASIRAQAAEAAKKLEEAKAKLNSLEYTGKLTSADYVEAVNAVTAANQEMSAVPQKVGGGIVTTCGLIKDPGGFVKTQLDNYINGWIKQSTDLKEGNIPLYAQLAKTLSKKLFKGILFDPKDTSDILTETGATFLTTALNASLTRDSDPATPTSNTIPIDRSQITDSPIPSTNVPGSGTGINPGNTANANNSGSSWASSILNFEKEVPKVPYTNPRGR